MDREQTIRARARMALRAEQAFGLRSLPLRIVEQKDVLENETPATSKSEPARVGPVACDPVDLFGKPLTKQPVQVPVPALDAFAAPALSRDEKIKRLNELDQNEVTGCTRCR